MQDASTIERIRRKFQSLDAVLDERSRRQWAASEAQELGYGGVSTVASATGMARDTIHAGLRELAYRHQHPQEPIGDVVWTAATAVQFGQEASLRPRGRPRKESGEQGLLFDHGSEE